MEALHVPDTLHTLSQLPEIIFGIRPFYKKQFINNPLSCVAEGTGKSLISIDLLKSGKELNKK